VDAVDDAIALIAVVSSDEDGGPSPNVAELNMGNDESYARQWGFVSACRTGYCGREAEAEHLDVSQSRPARLSALVER
jgi:hypothetical protein